MVFSMYSYFKFEFTFIIIESKLALHDQASNHPHHPKHPNDFSFEPDPPVLARFARQGRDLAGF
ncbi:hypothetical protein [Polaromonas sp.]|uniref:hypothetical protein n=1 Tax=Polaromonas sp. TaxID=1869339 RepID=UPI001844303A|nr:hypothetical protein [Polaromonas sp.]NMM07069.1 hypothetical protein [Polaromonas sp.]